MCSIMNNVVGLYNTNHRPSHVLWHMPRTVYCMPIRNRSSTFLSTSGSLVRWHWCVGRQGWPGVGVTGSTESLCRDWFRAANLVCTQYYAPYVGPHTDATLSNAAWRSEPYINYRACDTGQWKYWSVVYGVSCVHELLIREHGCYGENWPCSVLYDSYYIGLLHCSWHCTMHMSVIFL